MKFITPTLFRDMNSKVWNDISTSGLYQTKYLKYSIETEVCQRVDRMMSVHMIMLNALLD